MQKNKTTSRKKTSKKSGSRKTAAKRKAAPRHSSTKKKWTPNAASSQLMTRQKAVKQLVSSKPLSENNPLRFNFGTTLLIIYAIVFIFFMANVVRMLNNQHFTSEEKTHAESTTGITDDSENVDHLATQAVMEPQESQVTTKDTLVAVPTVITNDNENVNHMTHHASLEPQESQVATGDTLAAPTIKNLDSQNPIDRPTLNTILEPHGWQVVPDDDGALLFFPRRASPSASQEAMGNTSKDIPIDTLRTLLAPHGWHVKPDEKGGALLFSDSSN